MRKFLVYYAHPMYLYGKAQEDRDIEMLEQMGFIVMNPADPDYATEAELRGNRMQYFLTLVERCDGLAFRGTPEGLITCGVAEEIKTAQNLGRPVIELPSMVKRRTLNIPDTLEYLHQVGER